MTKADILKFWVWLGVKAVIVLIFLCVMGFIIKPAFNVNVYLMDTLSIIAVCIFWLSAFYDVHKVRKVIK